MKEPTLSEEEVIDIRNRVSMICRNRNITRSKIALDSGLASSTFSQFMSKKYEGDVAKVALSLKKWLRAFVEKEAYTKKIGNAGQYIETSISTRIWHVLRYCNSASDMGAILGVPGMGKSETAKEYVKQNIQAHYISVSPSSGDLAPLLARIVSAIGRESQISHARYLRAVIDDELSSAHLLVIDEAQHLTAKALEEIRAIHDETRCGIVMMGNHTVITRLKGPAKSAQFSQLTSRLGMKYTVPTQPPEEDVRLIAKSLYDFDETAIEFLIRVSRKHGALRSVVKTIKLARMLTSGTKTKTDIGHLEAAYSQLS